MFQLTDVRTHPLLLLLIRVFSEDEKVLQLLKYSTKLQVMCCPVPLKHMQTFSSAPEAVVTPGGPNLGGFIIW